MRLTKNINNTMQKELTQSLLYLPFAVKYLDSKENKTYELDADNVGLFILKFEYLDRAKLVLRPLEDIAKDIDGNGFIPIVELLKMQLRDTKIDVDNDEIAIKKEYCYSIAYLKNHSNITVSIDERFLESLPFWIIEKLLEWHIDVFGLIPKGHAVDFNNY